jgi:hypothetical protein
LKLETITVEGQKVRQVSCDKCGAKLQIIAADIDPDQVDALLKGPMSRHVCPPKKP